jgi:hypothetical protein
MTIDEKAQLLSLLMKQQPGPRGVDFYRPSNAGPELVKSMRFVEGRLSEAKS